MIVTDYDDLKSLMNGERIDVLIGTRAPVIGSTVSVQPAVAAKTVCRAEVLDTWEHARGAGVVVALGGNVVVVGKLEAKPKRVRRVVIQEEPVRLMKRSGGSTSVLAAGMRDSSTGNVDLLYGAELEPEMVPKDWQDPGVPLRAAQQAALDQATQERLSFGETLDGLLAEVNAMGGDATFKQELRQLAAARERLERRLRRERAQRATA